MKTATKHAVQAGTLTRRTALLAGSGGAALALAGCGGGELALVVPYITFFFFQGVVTDAGGTARVVSLNLNVTNVFTDKATGNHDAPKVSLADTIGGSFVSFEASGSFSGSSLSLNVLTATAPLATAHQGEFVEPDTIVLTPLPSGPPVIRLVRVDNSFRRALDASTWAGTDANQEPWTIHLFLNPRFSKDATELLIDDDVLSGLTNGTIKGYATMRRLEITVTRGGAAAVALSGRFGPSGTTPPGNDFAPATTLVFTDGSR